ncbi:MAG TPA: hypothetical protein VK911_07270, partial [Vicinamibacterales bacterium]|nr:hypothetical protein [Vicinamibacterales bacterium]
MKYPAWNAAGARVLAAMFIIAGAAACGDDATNVSTRNGGDGDATVASRSDASESARERSGLPSDASSSAVVIGTAPAEPTPDNAATTSPPGGQSELSKGEQSRGMPNEGD